MSEERDQILERMRGLWEEFGHEFTRFSDIAESGAKGCEYASYFTAAWSDACCRLKALIDELDPDSLIPVELPLKWHSNHLEYIEACSESLSRGMNRKCVQCPKCKAGMEVEVAAGVPHTRKRLRCSCGHDLTVSFFQGEQNAG